MRLGVQRLNRAGIRDCNWLWLASADIKLALVWVSTYMEPHYEPLVCSSGPGDALATVGFKEKTTIGEVKFGPTLKN